MKPPLSHAVLAALALAGVCSPVLARSDAGPRYLAAPARVPQPVDHAFAGVIEIEVDATDVPRRLFTVHQRIPVAGAAQVTLLYPRWEAASHGPSLTVTDLAGLQITAAGKRLAWQRDGYEPHAFHVQVPAGTPAIDVTFQMVNAGNLLTPEIVSVPWQRLVVYPAGWYARNIPVAATLTLPAGMRAFTSLEPERSQAATLAFRTTSLETLLDSPVLAGRHAARVPLASDGMPPVSLDIIALRSGDLEVPAARVAELRRLVAQMSHVFGPAPFHRYEILARLSDEGSTGGTEHRASSENELSSSHFRAWDDQILFRDLIAHEIIHAWNGFYRTPGDLWAPTPNVPVSGSLLWMYEGQTEFWGRVLATRAGQFSPAELRDRLAIEAAEIANRPGRAWRPLSDDVNYPAFMLRQAMPWRDWQRRRDYYSEGVMLWLAVDARLRELTHDRRSIDDFAARFFAGATPDGPTRTYTFEDVCSVLNTLAPADWAGILRSWLDAHDELDTQQGLNRMGWKLVYTEAPTAAFTASEGEAGVSDLSYSIGITARDNGVIRSVVWNGPAFRARLRAGTRIVKVNGAPYSTAGLLAAVRRSAQHPVALEIEQDQQLSSVVLDYRGPPRYPRLVRQADQPDRLSRLLAPR